LPSGAAKKNQAVARAHPFQDQVAGNLDGEIGQEEDAGAPGVTQRIQPDIAVHRQRREADIDPVKLVDQEHRHHQGQQAPHDLGHGAAFQLRLLRQGAQDLSP
jgi:hypothetical protein